MLSKKSTLTNFLREILIVNGYIYVALAGISAGLMSRALENFPFFPPRGILATDLGRHIERAIRLQAGEDLNRAYPSGWYILMNILSFFTDGNVVDAVKPSILFLFFLSTIIKLIIYTEILSKHVAGSILLLTQALNTKLIFEPNVMYFHKFLISEIIIALTVAVVFILYKDNNTRNLRNLVIYISLGALLGIATEIYWGGLYWILFSVVCLLALLYKQKNALLSSKVLDIVIGFLLVMTPVIVSFITANLSYFPKSLIIIVLYVSLIAIVLIRVYEEKSSRFIYENFYYLVPFIILSSIGSFLVFYSVNDPSLKYLGTNTLDLFRGNNLILIIIFSAVLFKLFEFKLTKDEKLFTLVLTLCLISTLVLGLYHASLMQFTNLANMWWQTKFVNEYLFSLLLASLFFLLIDKLLIAQENKVPNNDSINLSVIASFLAFVMILDLHVTNAWNLLDTSETSVNMVSALSEECNNIIELKDEYVKYLITLHPNFVSELLRSCHAKQQIEDEYKIKYENFYDPDESSNSNLMLSYRWSRTNEGKITLYHTYEDKVQIKLKLLIHKAPCLDQLNLKINSNSGLTYHQNIVKSRQTIFFRDNLKSFDLLQLDLISDSTACIIPNDSRQLVFSIAKIEIN